MASRPRLQTTAELGGDCSLVNPAPMGAEQLLVAETDELDDVALSALIGFFRTLDQWEAKRNEKVM